MPPCQSTGTFPKPASKPTVSKPAAPAAPVARPVKASPPLAQTVSSPAVSTRIPSRSVTERDGFAAQVPTPRLVTGSTAVRVGAQVEFQVLVGTVTSIGSLLGQAAEIRFTPIGALIATGDGATLQGSCVTHRYREAGVYSARATVRYQVDYRIGSGNWVLNAAVLDSASNSLSVQVLEPRKRTLLVN